MYFGSSTILDSNNLGSLVSCRFIDHLQCNVEGYIYISNKFEYLTNEVRYGTAVSVNLYNFKRSLKYEFLSNKFFLPMLF